MAAAVTAVSTLSRQMCGVLRGTSDGGEGKALPCKQLVTQIGKICRERLAPWNDKILLFNIKLNFHLVLSDEQS